MLVIFTYFTAVFLALMGIIVLCYPSALTWMYGTNHSCAEWKNEFKAVYGGFGIATGTLLYVTSYFNFADKDGVQLCMGVAFLGMAFGRLIAFLFERTGKWPIIFLLTELVLGLLLIENATHILQVISHPYINF